MIENLKIALRRQKKLIIIFLVTIVLPSVSLGIFGILAIRNEEFRLVQQRENEQRGTIELLKTRLHARLTSLEGDLQNIGGDPSFSTSDQAALARLAQQRLIENPLVEQVFLLPNEGQPFFPLFRGEGTGPAPVISSLTENVAQELQRSAQEREHVRRDYAGAAKLYEELFHHVRTRNDRAQMLSNRARNLMKLGQHRCCPSYIRLRARLLSI